MSTLARATILSLLMFGLLPVWAQTPAPTGDEDPTAPRKGRDPYRRSKLTRDESEAIADRRRLRITKGEDRTVDLDFDPEPTEKGLSIGNSQVVEVRIVRLGDRRQALFRGKEVGETTVYLRDPEGNLRLVFGVTVTGSNLERRAAELRQLLRDIEGIEIRIVGQKIVIDGELLIPADWGRLMGVISDKVYADQILNLANISPLGLQVVAKRIQDDVNTFAPNVKTRVVNGAIFLEGTINNEAEGKRALDVASVYLPAVRPQDPVLAKDPTALANQDRRLIYNFMVINAPPPKKQEKLVRITFHFVELSKNYLKNFGFKWQPGFTAQPQISIGNTGADAAGGVAAQGPSFSGTISSLFPRLQSGQSAGYARVLKTSTVITRSGKEARLNEQTQIPYAIGSGGQGQPTAAQMANVGLDLKVTPSILGQSEDIELNMALNQINLTDRAPGAAPATTNHLVTTSIYVKNGESAAVAGVNGGDTRTDFNGDDPRPGAAAQGTEPLFTLLRSKRYEKKRSQFVIFVTPQILENPSEGTEDLKKNFRVKVK